MVDSVRDIVSFSQRSSGRWSNADPQQKDLCWNMPQNYKRWLAWWYFAIAAGFAALAVDHMLLRDVPWLIGIRLILCAGFGFLAWMEFRNSRRRRS